MSNWTIKRRVATGFALVICIVLALGVFALTRLTPINDSTKLIVSDCLPGVAAIGDWVACLKQNRALIQNYVLADAGPAKDKIGGEINANKELITTLMADYEKTVSQPAGQKLFAEVKNERATFSQTFNAVMDLSAADKKQEAVELFMGKMVTQYENYLAAITKQENYNHTSAAAAGAQISQAVASARIGIWVGLICAFGSALALAFIIISSTTQALAGIVSKLESGTIEVESSAESFRSSSNSFAEGASQQAASLEETSASLEEISSMTKRNADNANNCKELSNQTNDSVIAGLERLSEMNHTVTSIKSAVRDMETAVHETQNSSQEIAKIIKTIDEIAFQTNLLALNAAVEAARAGEAGMGFAVVADEVRALAQRSAQAARDTANKIEIAVKRSEFGGVASAKVVKNLAEVEGNARNIEQVFKGIVTQIKSLDGVIGQIAAASQEQSSGISEVNMAVSQMDKLTQNNAAYAEENASAATELTGQVTSMKNLVVGLQNIVGGDKPMVAKLDSSAKNTQTASSRPNVISAPIKRAPGVTVNSFENF